MVPVARPYNRKHELFTFTTEVTTYRHECYLKNFRATFIKALSTVKIKRRFFSENIEFCAAGGMLYSSSRSFEINNNLQLVWLVQFLGAAVDGVGAYWLCKQ